MGMHTDSKRFPFKGNGFTFRVDNYIKIILSPFLKGVYITVKGKNLLRKGLMWIRANKKSQKFCLL